MRGTTCPACGRPALSFRSYCLGGFAHTRVVACEHCGLALGRSPWWLMWWVPAFIGVCWVGLHPPDRVGFPQAFGTLAALAAVVAASAWLSWGFSAWVRVDDGVV